MVEMRERYRGALVGVLAGDSLLAPFEGMKSAQILLRFNRGEGVCPRTYVEPFARKRVIQAGEPTDDAQLTAALGYAIARPDFEVAHIYHELRRFIHGVGYGPRESILTDGKPYGSGGTLRSALRAHTYEESLHAFREGLVRVLPTNGSLMRNAVIALRYHGNMDAVIEYARRQSCVTHVHPSAQVACIAHAILMAYVLDGLAPFPAWEATCAVLSRLQEQDGATRDKLLWDNFTAVLAMPCSMPRENEIWPHSGDVLISLRIAVAAFLGAASFQDGLEQVAVVGGDTDTYGAIAGALLGAHFGLSAIPAEWCRILRGNEKMLSLADSLFACVHP